MTDTFNPDAWLTSLFDAMTDYIESGVNAAVLDSDDAPVGSTVYNVVMAEPAADDLPFDTENDKTIIHFEIDDIQNKRLGFGDGFVAATTTEADDANPATETPQEAVEHVVNFDVGIWATDKSGGVTARLRAYEILDKLLSGDVARVNCRTQTAGVEIRSFMNGRFVKDTINDVRVFRMVGAELVVRVYSRNVANTATIVDEEPVMEPDLVISNDSGSYDDLTD